jgi:Zn/Cd-binding protein ZinT
MKSVHELNQDELEELRSRWYYQHLDDGSLEEVMGKNIDSEHDVPMSIVKTYYEDTYFVEDDFWCNQQEFEINR